MAVELSPSPPPCILQTVTLGNPDPSRFVPSTGTKVQCIPEFQWRHGTAMICQ